MMDRVYSIDYKRLVVLLLPTFLRRPVLFSLLKSMVLPIITLHSDFLSQRRSNIFQANHTGQVCYLRGMLNDAFDATLRRIYISDAEALEWTMLYKKELFNPAGGKHPLMLGKADSTANGVMVFSGGVRLVSKQGSVGAIGSDFAVMIPLALRGAVDESRVISLVNIYKLASKRYVIQYY